MKQTIIVLFITLLASCMTPKKADKFLDKNPEFTAKQCADRFPIMETTDTLTVYDTALIKAYEMEFGYLYYMLDSLLGKQIPDSTKKEIVTIFQDKKVPVVKYKYITKVQESSAKVQVIRDSCQKMSTKMSAKLDSVSQQLTATQEKCQKYKGQRDNYLWLLILFAIALFRRPLARVISKTVKPF